MLSIIVTVILVAAIFTATGFVREKSKDNGYPSLYVKFKLNKRQLLALLPLILLVFNFIAYIPVNNVGILYSPIHGVKEETLSNGIKTKGFFDEVYTIDTEVQTVQLSSITGQTKDSQWVNMTIDIKYQVNKETAYQVFKQYNNLENVGNVFIPPAVQKSVERITTKYNIMDFLGDKRNQVYDEIELELKSKFSENGIEFRDIAFIDTDAGDAIEKAIEAEATAKQNVKKAEQERLTAEIEAQKAVVTAEAEKEAAIIKAETKLIEAKAEADANREISQSITPELIQKMEMDARIRHGWVTTNIGNGTPIINTNN